MMIKYQNGGKDIFDNGPKTDQPIEPKVVSRLDEPFIFDKELYIKGQADAYKYYYKYKGAGTGTLVTSLLLNGLFGLIPAIGCSLTPPKMKNLCYPSQELMDNPSYCKGYKDGAKKRKQQKVWLNWGIGTIISTTIILIAASAQ
jgi:hypothetical protein